MEKLLLESKMRHNDNETGKKMRRTEKNEKCITFFMNSVNFSMQLGKKTKRPSKIDSTHITAQENGRQ